MFVEQAIFTSVRSGRNEGYQIAATSPHVSLDDQRELAKWGPGHDSLYETGPAAESVSFHRLESGLYCLSRTSSAGREYSGRGGCRIYTQSFLIPPQLLERFRNHPLRIMEALVVSGRAAVVTPVPDRLDPVPVVGRASAVNVVELERLCEALGPTRLAALVSAALKTELLGISAPVRPRLLLAGLLSLIPVRQRPQYSWTTGLRVSPRRPYRWAALPADREEHRQAIRLIHLTTLDLNQDVPTKYAAHGGWPLLVYNLLRDHRFSDLAAAVDATTATTEDDPNVLAEQTWARLEQNVAVPNLFTPWSAAGSETAGISSGYHGAPLTPPGGIAR